MANNQTEYSEQSPDLTDLSTLRCEFDNCLWIDWNNTIEKSKINSMKFMGLRTFVHHMNEYGIPSMVSLGCLFNLAAFFVFVTNSNFRKISSAIYFSILAVANIAYLVALLIIWLKYYNIRIFHRSGWCQLVLYATYLSSFLSAWSIVCLSLERYKFATAPLRSKYTCTRQKSKKLATSLILFSLIVYSYVPWTTGILYLSGIPSCAPFTKYFTILRIMTGIDTLLTVILPTVLITIFNIKTISIIYKKRKQKIKNLNNLDESSSSPRYCLDVHNQFVEERNHGSNTITDEESNNLTTQNQENSTARMIDEASQEYNDENKPCKLTIKMEIPILVLTTVYILINLPSHAMKVYIYVEKFTGSNHLPLNSAMIQEIFQFMYYISFSINFIIIFITSSYFRQALGKMLLNAVDKLHNILISA